MPWSALRELLEEAGEESAVVVDAQHRPIGSISLRNLLAWQQEGGNNPATDWSGAIAPIVSLALSSSPKELAAALAGGKPCVLVDSDGAAVGRPNLARVLDESIEMSYSESRVSSVVVPASPAAPWLAFFEQLPLPLLLQTANGQILARNQVWRETFCTAGGSTCSRVAVDSSRGTGKAATEWCVLGTAEEPAAGESGKRLCPLCAGDRSLGQVGSWCLTRLPLDDLDEDTRHPLWLVLASDTSEQQQLYRELAARNADLAHLNRLKDEFLACISHELKSPLTAIVGLSSLLQQPTLGELNSRQERYVKLIHQSGRQLMALVNDILDLTRLESGRLVLHPTQLDITAICEGAYEAAKAHAASQLPSRELADIPYTLAVASDLETIEADELRLRQILTHLLSNALKFTQADKGRVGLRVNRWEGWIAFTIWDEGIGIPTAQQHLIFQKFQQLEGPLTREREGTGLGLVLAQRLARAHGGDISFVSEADRGSEFTLLLPPFPPPATHAASVPVGRPRPHTSLSTLVLLVETVPRYVDSISQLLQQLGYRAAIARSSTEAVAKARILQPRAILLDPFLSPLSGWDVLTLLKSDPHTRAIPTLVMASRAERQQAQERGADGFLPLPVSERALQEHLALANPTRSTTPIHRQNLTVLRLEYGGRREFAPPLETALGNISGQLNCRILEAEDLEQANLLARIWHPNAVLLDSSGCTVPREYLQQLSLCRPVAALPLIVLDPQAAQVAHELGALTVFPCFVAGEANPTDAIWSAIQVAAGVELSETDAAPHILIADGRSHLTEDTHHREWLQAAAQYLATAGYRSSLAQSWVEVRSQIQRHGVDLLLLDLGAVPEERATLLEGELETLLGPELGVPAIVLAHPPAGEAGAALAALLDRLAVAVLPGHPESMADLLAQIERLTEQL